MVPRDGGVGRQKQLVGQVIAALEGRRLEIENRGDQDDAVRIDALLLQPSRKAGRSSRAVTFTREKFRRAPSTIARHPEANELADRFDIRFDAVEFARVFERNRSAESGRHRIDEDEIGDVEQRIVVVDEAIRWHRGVAFIVAIDDALRTECAHVQPDR